MKNKKRMIGIGMSIRLGIVMSFFLSLTGTLVSGHFTITSFLISFVVSTVISLLIGFLIPVGQVTESVCKAAGLKHGTLPCRLLEAFIANLIYTPIMTFLMVYMAYQMVMKQTNGMAQLNLLGMYFRSLGKLFFVGFVLLFFFQPLFYRQLMKKYEDT
ncbi:MAG: hypothetical protein K6E91_10285 [Butyrivibrio sp.]|nr:hypothetical protein [Butyrivibrio sp.]